MTAPDVSGRHNTIVAFDPVRNGAFVTVLDSFGVPQLIAFDLEDLDHFTAIAEAVRAGDPTRRPDDRVRFTPRGMEYLRGALTDGAAAS